MTKKKAAAPISTSVGVGPQEAFLIAVREAQDCLDHYLQENLDWFLLAAFDALQRAEAERRYGTPSPAAEAHFSRLHRSVLNALTGYARKTMDTMGGASSAIAKLNDTRIINALHAEYQRTRLQQAAWLSGKRAKLPPNAVEANVHARVATALGTSKSKVYRAWIDLASANVHASEKHRLCQIKDEVEANARAITDALRQQPKPTKKQGWTRLNISKKPGP